MPAYANTDGKVVCFFQGAAKFDARYADFGIQRCGTLDDDSMWPVSFAIVEWTPALKRRSWRSSGPRSPERRGVSLGTHHRQALFALGPGLAMAP